MAAFEWPSMEKDVLLDQPKLIRTRGDDDRTFIFGLTKLQQQTKKRLDMHRNSAMRGRAKARISLLPRAIPLRD